MVLPIIAYGNAVLKIVTEEIMPGHPGLDRIISDMFETMYAASGVGLAAPQVNLPIRMFIVDASPFGDEEPQTRDFKKVFINPFIVERSGETVLFEEGCLSFPGIREEVSRPSVITLRYKDEQFQEHTETYEGMIARIVQHEYDHVDGILMVDHMSNLRKMVLKRRLNDLIIGNVKVGYKMQFVPLKKSTSRSRK